jgi:hypothetical protein
MIAIYYLWKEDRMKCREGIRLNLVKQNKRYASLILSYELRYQTQGLLLLKDEKK